MIRFSIRNIRKIKNTMKKKYVKIIIYIIVTLLVLSGLWEISNKRGNSIFETIYSIMEKCLTSRDLLLFTDVFPSFFDIMGVNEIENKAVLLNTADDTNFMSLENAVIYDDDIITKEIIDESSDYTYAISKLFTIDSTAYVYPEELNLKRLSEKKLTTDLTGDKPKILIFHTHSSENFTNSRTNKSEDTIIGVGDTLADILNKEYNVSTIHFKGVFDVLGGKEDREGSYERMEPVIKKILADNPSIKIVIDLHRDALPNGKKLVAEINNKPTAMLMFFNGICRRNDKGKPVEMDYLTNNYLEDNLAFSLQMKLKANELYPTLTRKNYIKPYRYSLHMAPLSLLIEAGASSNTVEEVKNAMPYLAEILYNVITEQ